MDPHQHFVRIRDRPRDLDDAQHLGRSETLVDDGSHGDEALY
jgi:hypothetical protein